MQITKAVAGPSAAQTDIHSIQPCGSCGARAYGLCGEVSLADLPRLASAATIAEVARGQTFIHEAAPADDLCILILGSAKLYKLLPDGRRQIIGFAYARSLLGLVATEAYSFSAEALEPIRLCRLSRLRLRWALSDYLRPAKRLLQIAINDLELAQEQMLLLGRGTVMERVASFLNVQARRPQPRGVEPPRIHLPMSRSDVADYLGLTIETVSRSLAKLKKSGVINVPNVHEIVILDPLRLQALARGSSVQSSALANGDDAADGFCELPNNPSNRVAIGVEPRAQDGQYNKARVAHSY